MNSFLMCQNLRILMELVRFGVGVGPQTVKLFKSSDSQELWQFNLLFRNSYQIIPCNFFEIF